MIPEIGNFTWETNVSFNNQLTLYTDINPTFRNAQITNEKVKKQRF